VAEKAAAGFGGTPDLFVEPFDGTHVTVKPVYGQDYLEAAAERDRRRSRERELEAAAVKKLAAAVIAGKKDFEAYIYVPTERSGQVRLGLDVELMDNQGKLLEKSKIDFLSPEVDSTLQGILVKASVHATPEILRQAQMVKARVVWSTTPMAVIPVLAVTRQGGQSFVFVARQQNGHFMAIQTPVTLGDTVGNTYSVSSGLNVGDRVIVSSTQFLVNGMPVLPLPGA